MTAKAGGLLQIGSFEPEIQSRLDAEFDCLRVEDLERAPGRAAGVRALVTRSNLEVPASLVERLPDLEIIATCGVGYDLIPLDLPRGAASWCPTRRTC